MHIMDETHRLKYTEYVVGCVSPILHYFLAPWEREGIAEEHLLFHVGTVSRGKISCVLTTVQCSEYTYTPSHFIAATYLLLFHAGTMESEE